MFFPHIIVIIITAGIHTNLFSLVRNFTSILSFVHHNNSVIVIKQVSYTHYLDEETKAWATCCENTRRERVDSDFRDQE